MSLEFDIRARAHWPAHRRGCRTGDAAECCAVCYLRLLRAVVALLIPVSVPSGGGR